jgi:pSer/pThr/pTyr-binding forkhead associated (FHA) protein
MGTVNRLQMILTQLESRLQAFFEGGAARLFPGGECAGLAQRLTEAMQAEIQTQPDGNLLAPNVFTIIVHPTLECALPEKAGLLGELADILQRSGEEADIRFLHPPVIRVITDAGLPPQEIQVLTAFSQSEAGDTTALRLPYSPEGTSTSGQVAASGGTAPTTEMDPASGAFLIVDGSQTLPLTRQGLTIGRRPDMSLCLENVHVSRVHAQIRLVQGRSVIFDLDSSGGTYVNGQRVTQCVLHPGDVISLAGVQLVFGQESSSPLDETQKLTL